MKLLSKLNGWQRLWLIVTVNLQLAGGVSRFFRGGAIERYLEGPLKCKTNTGYISPYLPNMPTCTGYNWDVSISFIACTFSQRLWTVLVFNCLRICTPVCHSCALGNKWVQEE